MQTPYYRRVQRHAKGKWIGRSLADIIPELGPGAKVLGDKYKPIQNGDLIKYDVHMHEPPVAQVGEPEISGLYVIIDKPSGIPTHPTVNYSRNTVVEMLRGRFGRLYPCYRLDSLTSGVLVLARSPEAANELLSDSSVKKIYLARVSGKMSRPELIALDLFDFNAKRGYDAFLTDSNSAKPSKTYVHPVGYFASNDTTLVRCELFTGRTHQIRKHLALIGHPVDNDPVYSSGSYRALYYDRTEAAFEALRKDYCTRISSKLTGTRCPECNTPEYFAILETLWLHCSCYSSKKGTFQAPDPLWARGFEAI